MKNAPANPKLIEALTLYQEKWLSRLPADDEMELYEFSPVFKKKMLKLIKAQKKPYYPLINTVGKRVAAVLIAVLIFTSGTVFSVKALRDPVVNFFIEVYEKFSRIVFQIDDPDESALTKIEEYFTPQYVPEGYVLKSEEKFDTVVAYEYQNSKGDMITYDQAIFNSSKMLIDTEGVNTEKITVNGLSGVFFSNKGYDNVIWDNGVYTFYVSAPSDIGKDEILAIAESVK